MADNKNAKGKKKGNNKNVSAKNNTKNATKVVEKVNTVERETVKAETAKVETTNTTNEPISGHRNIIIALVAGIVVGLVIMLILMPDRIATIQNGEEVIVNVGDQKITADDLYKDMKKFYSVNILLDTIDKMVLEKVYPEDNDMKTEVNKMADYYISMYETYYGYSEAQFLEANGFATRDDFLDALKLDYRRNKCLEAYAKKLVEENESEIKKYYDNNVFGDIETKYIQVNGTDDEAKALAQKVINRLKNGESYESIVEHYGSRVSSEDLGFISFDSELDSTYLTALKGLKDGKFTEEPVLSSEDYKVIIRVSSKDKASYEDVKDKIVTILADKKKEEDSTLSYKALVEVRKENNVAFKDTDLAKKYDEYVKKNTSNDNEQ